MSMQNNESATVFEYDGKSFSISLSHVRGISRLGSLTKVPGAGSGIFGLTNYYGELIAVISPFIFFNNKSCSCTNESLMGKFLVVLIPKLGVSILADSVTGVSDTRNNTAANHIHLKLLNDRLFLR